MPNRNLTRTGIKGLDGILLGGIPSGNITLLQGGAGAGKTVLGLEFIYQGIVKYDEPGIVVVFEVSPDKLIRDALTFGWDLRALQDQKKLQIVFTTPKVLDQEMRSPDSLLVETAGEMGARRIFIDGIGLLRPSAGGIGSPVPATGANSYREILQQLIENLNRENLTAILSSETGTLRESVETQEAAAFLCDTVIRLERGLINRRSKRTIEIVKSRGHDYDQGQHTLLITDGKGMEVVRRVQAPIRSRTPQPWSIDKRSVIGVEALDTLIGGGIFDGSTTMVVGVSGVGKTVLGTQLLLEGAKGGKKGLLISLDEHPAQIVRNAGTIGLDLQEQIDAGAIHIPFESPQELDVDSHFAKIVRTIEENDIQRLVVDGMTSYSTTLTDRGGFRDFFHALVAYSKQRLMNTFFNYENPDVLGISSFMPEFPVSSIVDNLILLNLVELGNELRRCLTVVKARGCKHSFDSREYEITHGGLRLLPVDENRVKSRPFSHYRSVLSHAPTRLSIALESPNMEVDPQ